MKNPLVELSQRRLVQGYACSLLKMNGIKKYGLAHGIQERSNAMFMLRDVGDCLLKPVLEQRCRTLSADILGHQKRPSSHQHLRIAIWSFPLVGAHEQQRSMLHDAFSLFSDCGLRAYSIKQSCLQEKARTNTHQSSWRTSLPSQ
jgi:hypothetical protein